MGVFGGADRPNLLGWCSLARKDGTETRGDSALDAYLRTISKFPLLTREDEVELAERIRQGLLAEAAAAGLPGYERPQRVVLLPESLSEEDGTLTKGLKKVVPKVIVEQYRELVEETYRS